MDVRINVYLLCNSEQMCRTSVILLIKPYSKLLSYCSTHKKLHTYEIVLNRAYILH